MILLHFLWLIVGPPLGAGTVFAVLAVVLRRRYGPLGLLALTILVVVAAVVVVKTVPFPDGGFAIPAIPAALAAAAVLEWRARRRSKPVAQVLWTALAFTVVGAGLLYGVVGQMMIVA